MAAVILAQGAAKAEAEANINRKFVRDKERVEGICGIGKQVGE